MEYRFLGRTGVQVSPICLGSDDVMEMILDDSLREACNNLVPPGSAVANFHNTSGWMIGQLG